MPFSLSIVIPAYNEQDTIANSLMQISSFLKQCDFEYEIIIVNDGSTDNTASIVSKTKDVILHNIPQNKGKGNAVKQGVLIAKKEYILFMDADHAIPISYIIDFKKLIDNHDIIIGSKYLEQTENYPLYRRFVGKIFSLLKYWITGLKYKDTQCGFKLFRKEVGKDIFNLSQINGWCFDVELLLIADKKGYSVKEFPVQLSTVNSLSKINVFNSGLQMFLDLIKLRLKFKKREL